MLGLGSGLGFLGNLNKALARHNRPSRKKKKRRYGPTHAQRRMKIKPRTGSLLQVPGIGLPLGRVKPNAEQQASIIAQIGGTQLRKRGQVSNNAVSRGY
tara:strand:+ start:5479 stop:5775 length:297 start_codon:yes stop_codon:yes gene_type:complete